MVKGKDLPLNDRQLIYQHVVFKNRNAKYIHENIFNSDNTRISLVRLTELVTMFKNKSGIHTHKIDSYLYGTNNRENNGRSHRIYFQESRNDIIRINKENPRMNLDAMVIEHQKFYVNHADAPKKSFISKVLHDEAKLRYKTIEYRHIRSRLRQFVAFLLSIQHVHPMYLHTTDEMSASPKSMMNNKGRGIIGKPLIMRQFKIGARTFSVIATYGIHGFICWRIFEGIVTSIEFQDYLSNTLSYYIDDDNHGIFDNSKTHTTIDSINEINRVCNGLYNFLSPYSAFGNPIERGFSLIRLYIKRNYAAALDNPILVLNNAFEEYSTFGRLGHRCKNHWSLYYRIHQNFLDNL